MGRYHKEMLHRIVYWSVGLESANRQRKHAQAAEIPSRATQAITPLIPRATDDLTGPADETSALLNFLKIMMLSVLTMVD